MKKKEYIHTFQKIPHHHPLVAFPDEQSCIDYVKKIKWPQKIICPFCQCNEVYHFKNNQIFKCKSCRKKFSVRIGTIFEGSKIPLQKWFIAIWLTNREHYITSVALAKELNISQKTAWSILHTLQDARMTISFKSDLSSNK